MKTQSLLPPQGAGRADLRHSDCCAAILPEILPDSRHAQRLFLRTSGHGLETNVSGLCMIRCRIHHCILKEDHEVSGFLYSMVGMIYAVLLAFVTITAWQQHRDTKYDVQLEALCLSNLLRDAQVFPDSVKAALQKQLVAYGRAVVSSEWNSMSKGEPSQTASEAYEGVWRIYYEVQPESEREITFYRESINRLNDLGSFRRSRLLDSRSRMPSLLWVLLIGGAVVCIGFTYMFGAKNTWAQVLTIGSLAGLIGFILFDIVTIHRMLSLSKMFT